MCQNRNSAKVWIPHQKRMARVDKCISAQIAELNSKGYKTLAACCGHKKYKPTIVVDEDGVNLELLSGRIIPRKKRFYINDKNGLFFIPEVEKVLKR